MFETFGESEGQEIKEMNLIILGGIGSEFRGWGYMQDRWLYLYLMPANIRKITVRWLWAC